MKNILIYFIAIVVIISGCKSGAANININDVEKHRAYQDSAIAKVKTPAEKLEVIKALISEYRNLDLKEKNTSSNSNYYLARLYAKITGADLPFNGFLYDTINKKLYDSTIYSNFIDSSIYYNETALKLDSNNLFAFSGIVYTIFSDQVHKEEKNQEYSAMPYYPNRHNVEYQRITNYIFDNATRFINIDTSKDKDMSRFALELSFCFLTNSLSGQELDYNDAKTLDQILKIDKHITVIDKFPNLSTLEKVFYEEIKNKWLPIIAQAKISYDKLHEWDNVTYVEYHNCEQMNLWIYSNGRYKQEIYKQDISGLSYDQQMNINSYDLICCTVPGCRKLITNKSEGRYVLEGSTYYFYPDKNSSYIIAGEDPNKNAKYMRLNDYGNLQYIREDYEEVVLQKR